MNQHRLRRRQAKPRHVYLHRLLPILFLLLATVTWGVHSPQISQAHSGPVVRVPAVSAAPPLDGTCSSDSADFGQAVPVTIDATNFVIAYLERTDTDLYICFTRIDVRDSSTPHNPNDAAVVRVDRDHTGSRDPSPTDYEFVVFPTGPTTVDATAASGECLPIQGHIQCLYIGPDPGGWTAVGQDTRSGEFWWEWHVELRISLATLGGSWSHISGLMLSYEDTGPVINWPTQARGGQPFTWADLDLNADNLPVIFTPPGISHPSTAVTPDGYLGVFVTDSYGRVWELPFQNGWKPWVNHGTPPDTLAVSAPSAVATSSSYVGALVTGANGHLEELYRNGANWLWTDHGTPPNTTAVGAPSAVARPSGLVEALVTGANGHIEEIYYNYNGPLWPWKDLGMPPNTAAEGAPSLIAASTNGPSGHLTALVRGANYHIAELYSTDDNHNWAWNDLGTPPIQGTYIASDPSALAAPSGYVGGFVTDGFGRMWELRFNHDYSWTWVNHDTPPNYAHAIGAPSAVGAPSGYVGALVRGSNGHVEELYQNGNNWSWTDHDVPPNTSADSDPSAVAAPWGYVGGLVIGANGHIDEVYYNYNGPHWPWTDHHILPPLSINRVEITQAIQDLYNREPLFKYKRTLVRVYLDPGHDSLAGVTTAVSAYDDANPTTPVWGPYVIGPATIPSQIRRERLGDTLNFELPSSGWIAGKVYRLHVSANPCIDITADPTNCVRRLPLESGEMDVPFTFYNSVPLYIAPIWGLGIDGQIPPVVSKNTLAQIVTRMSAMYPTGRIVVHDNNWFVSAPITGITWDQMVTFQTIAKAGDATTPPGQEPPNCSSCFFVGIQPGCSMYWCGLAGGLEGGRPGHHALVGVYPNDINGSTYTMAQELAHEVGRLHASNAHDEQPPTDPYFPYSDGEISDNELQRGVGNIISWGRDYGTDPATNPLHPPDSWWIIPAYDPGNPNIHHHDFMSYGGGSDIWTSAYTYNALCGVNRIGWFDSWYSHASNFPAGTLPPQSICPSPSQSSTSSVPPQKTQGVPINVVLVRGTIHNNTSVNFAPGYILQWPENDPDVVTPGSGDYQIQLRDATGAILQQRSFSPLTHSKGDSISFAETMLWNVNTSTIVITYNGVELGGLTRRQGAPSGAFTFLPHGVFNMPSPVKWNSAQADGQGKLTASLLFSSDGGQTWRMIAVDITGTTFIVDPAHLPGTQQGQLRLQITDGLNTTTIDGPRDLQIPARPPGVFITEPIDGSYVGPGSHLLLRADAISPQEGTLGDKALHWYVGTRLLGEGRDLDVSDLSAGSQLLRLEASDTQGLVTSQQIRVYLSPTSVAVLGTAPGTMLPSLPSDTHPFRVFLPLTERTK